MIAILSIHSLPSGTFPQTAMHSRSAAAVTTVVSSKRSSSSRNIPSCSAAGRRCRFRSLMLGALLVACTAWPGASPSLRAELRVPVEATQPPASGRPNSIAVPGATGGPGDSSSPDKAGKSDTPDLLFFLNGDKLRGKLLLADASANTLKWQTGQAQQDILFVLPGLKEVQMGERSDKTAPAVAEGSFAVTLKNGDELPGTIVSMDDKNLVLETPYAGTLTIERKALAGMVPMRGSSTLLFDGPKDMEGWETQQGQRNSWRYKDGALVSTRNGFAGKDFKLPDMSTIEFDLSWVGNFSLGICIYTDELKSYGGNAYMLQVGNGYIYLSRMSRNGGQNQMGQVQVESMQRKSSCRVRLCTNKEQKSISLYIDDVLVRTFKDTASFAGNGTGVSFYNQGQGLIRLRRIRISKWDGRIAEESNSAAAKGTPEDTIILGNQDKVTGKITAIKNGSAVLESPYATLNVPLQRVDLVTFANGEPVPKQDGDKKPDPDKKDDKAAADAPAQPENAAEQQVTDPNATPKPSAPAEAQKRVPGEVGIHLVGRGRITIKLEKWDADKVTGTTANLGKVTILPQSIKILRFGPETSGGTIPGDVNSEEGEGGDGEGEDLAEAQAPIVNRPVFRRIIVH